MVPQTLLPAMGLYMGIGQTPTVPKQPVYYPFLFFCIPFSRDLLPHHPSNSLSIATTKPFVPASTNILKGFTIHHLKLLLLSEISFFKLNPYLNLLY